MYMINENLIMKDTRCVVLLNVSRCFVMKHRASGVYLHTVYMYVVLFLITLTHRLCTLKLYKIFDLSLTQSTYTCVSHTLSCSDFFLHSHFYFFKNRDIFNVNNRKQFVIQTKTT